MSKLRLIRAGARPGSTFAVEPNMYCTIDESEWYWVDWNDDDAELPTCPLQHAEPHTLDWIGT